MTPEHLANKIIFFDTNCYRFLTRTDASSMKSNLAKMKQKEKENGIQVHLTYLVASELFTHLADPIENQNYQECKKALSIAIEHVDKDYKNFDLNPEYEFYRFLFSTLPEKERERDFSLFSAILKIDESGYNDKYIKENNGSFEQTKEYIQTQKDSWLQLMFDRFIKKYDPESKGWKVFENDEQKKAVVLKEIITA
ncbi:hypothetical protein [Segetibacter koreensis]|uniref:hypothetical protein n=1 Tax=Segetibacter koreensis TaxID=398037 RepID=UPI00038117FB|nr:hypothetical protein [Segetibacter koreensis]